MTATPHRRVTRQPSRLLDQVAYAIAVDADNAHCLVLQCKRCGGTWRTTPYSTIYTAMRFLRYWSRSEGGCPHFCPTCDK